MTTNDEQLNIVDEEQPSEQITDSVADTEIDNRYSEPTAEVKQQHSKAEIIINITLWIAIALLLVAVILRLFVFNTVAVDGASMNPTYEHGNVVTVNKAAIPKRGDVVVFYRYEVDSKFMAQFAKPEQCAQGQPYEKLIKRVVATAGDKIWVRRIADNGDDVIYQVVVDTVDGDRVTENYYVKRGEQLPAENYYIHTVALSGLGNLADCTEDEPLVVSEGCFFAMGDNRINSKDSRELGEFRVAQVFGVVLDK